MIIIYNFGLLRLKIYWYQHILFVPDYCLTLYKPLFKSLGLSSLTHYLQIYCTRLIVPRFHIFWIWATNRDPTIGAICGKNLSGSENNSQIWQTQAHIKQNPWHLNMKTLSPILNVGEIKRAMCTLRTQAKATLELGVTSLKNNTIKSCKGKLTSLRGSYAMHNENELSPRLIPPLTMRRIAVIDVD